MRVQERLESPFSEWKPIFPPSWEIKKIFYESIPTIYWLVDNVKMDMNFWPSSEIFIKIPEIIHSFRNIPLE